MIEKDLSEGLNYRDKLGLKEGEVKGILGTRKGWNGGIKI